MQRSQRAILIAALLAVSPTALATWGAKGSFEPDTLEDVDSSWMTIEADTDQDGPPTVYFSGFFGIGGAVTTSLNPNLAIVETSILATPSVPLAILGVWKDCNRDGFIGLGDNGAFEYRSILLMNSSICPPASPATSRPWSTHNDGSWVVEFMPIGYDDITTGVDENPLNLNDTKARVWADWGLPDTPSPLICPVAPTPYGTFRSTGGLLRWADCFDGYRVGAALTQAAAAGGVPGLGFGDAPPDRPDRSGSALNRQNPWGDEDDAAIVGAFDCSDARPISVFDPTGGSLDLISNDEGRILTATLFAPDPRLDPSGTPSGSVNETEAGLTDCDRSNPGEVVDLNGRQGGSDGNFPYGFEDGAQPTTPSNLRSRTDHAFVFEEGSRGGAPALMLGSRTREHGGLGTAGLAGMWVAAGDGRALGPNAFVSRSTIGPERVLHITYYAHVERDLVESFGLRLPAGLSFAHYGSAGCASGAFACDEDAWWRDAAGRDVIPRDGRLGEDPNDPGQALRIPSTEIGVRIGAQYNLRDIDCIDSSNSPSRISGIHWGIASDSACVRP